MIYCYNKPAVGDTLLVIVGNSQGQEVASESKNDITRVFLADSNETVGLNFFNISQTLGTLDSVGQLHPTAEQVAQLNQLLQAAGFADVCTLDETPKIVTAFVKACKKHPDSDHLSITQVELADGETQQIVCGAANIKAGLKVVVALPGALMPDGLVIWPGELRGIASYGMICSARELGVANAPAKKGILELPFDTEVGVAFDAATYKI